MEKRAPISVDLTTHLIEDTLIQSIPGNLVVKHHFMPVFRIGNTLTIATSAPDPSELIQTLQTELGMEVESIYVGHEEIAQAIDRYYSAAGMVKELVSLISEEEALYTSMVREDAQPTKRVYDLILDESEPPIVRLVNLIFQQAILKEASDIHICPMEETILVRLRVDGTLQESLQLPPTLLPSIIARIKVMSGMDIAESRIPQDGHTKVNWKDQITELRVSTFLTLYGENTVIRLLGRTDKLASLESMGFLEDDLKTFLKLIEMPQGMILVTGPTGSGKTTTLYGALAHLNKITENIVTLEDPVEYEMSLVRQAQVNPKAGFTFARGLRAILRQDPDIILVGEIRDLETAELAVRASLTGHLVFSTLHTNDAPGTIARLVDMGIAGFLVLSSLTGILAQRLVRRNCEHCKETYTPDDYFITTMKLDPKGTYYRGKGCQECSQSGYKGRVGLFELLVLNDEFRHLSSGELTASQIRKHATDNGMKPLIQDGIEKIKMGVTTPEEVLKVATMPTT